MSVPDSLAHKMELFRRRGRVITYKDGLFLEPSWLAVYFGQRVMPRAYDPLADALDSTELEDRLGAMRAQVEGAVLRMPTHEMFLSKYCPAHPSVGASRSSR
jgi:tryptophan halogenase